MERTYVVVECVGGPCDGRRLLLPFPSPPVIKFLVPRKVPAAELFARPEHHVDEPAFVTVRYVAAPGWFETVHVQSDCDSPETRRAIRDLADSPRTYLFGGM